MSVPKIQTQFARIWLIVIAAALAGCVTSAATPSEQRQAVVAMQDQVLADLYQIKPDVRSQIANAPGYGVFTNANVHVFLVSAGGGYGLVKNNLTGKTTYMKMGELGVGLGAGIKDFRVVFVFHNSAAMNRFVEHGWAFGGNADAAAKAGEQGAAVGVEAVADNVTVYQLTESGLALQATIKGTKFWVDPELN
jgi:lipid-binding SYLF domain-containing protein